MQTMRKMNDFSTIEQARAALADIQRQIGMLNVQHVTLSKDLDEKMWEARMGDQRAETAVSKISTERAGVETERDRLQLEAAALHARIERMAEGEHLQYWGDALGNRESIIAEAQHAQDEPAAQIIAAGETGQRLNHLDQEWIRVCVEAGLLGGDIGGDLKGPAPAVPLFQASLLMNPAGEVARWKRNSIAASTPNPPRAALPGVRVVTRAGRRARAAGRGSVRSKGYGPSLRQYRDIFNPFLAFESPEAMATAAYEAAHAVVAAALGYRVHIVRIDKPYGDYIWEGKCWFNHLDNLDETTRRIEDSVITIAPLAGLDWLEGILPSSQPEGLSFPDATSFRQAVVALGEDYGSFLTSCLRKAGHLLDQHALAWRYVTYELIRFEYLDEDHLRTIAPALFSQWEHDNGMHSTSPTCTDNLPAQCNAPSKAETSAVREEL